MIVQMASAIALPGFNDLGCLVTPIFLLTDHFLHRFCTKKEENLSIRSLIFWKNMHHWIPFFLALHLFGWQFQMPLLGLSLVKTLATLILELLTQWVHLTLIYLWYFRLITLETMLIKAPKFVRTRLVFQILYLWNKDCDPQFFFFQFWNQ